MIVRCMVVVVLVASASATARGQAASDAAAAQKLYDAGQASHTARRYDEAIALWQRGFLISGAPAFLYNIAQAHRLAERCPEALDFYQRYAASKGVAPSRAVQQRITQMRQCVADAKTRQAASAPAIVSHRPARKHRRTRLWLAVGAVSVGGFGLAAAGYYGLDARAANRDIQDLYASGGTFDEQYWAVEERGQRAEKRAIVLAAVGAALVATGTVLYLTRVKRRDAHTGAAATVSIAPLPSGGGVWCSVSY